MKAALLQGPEQMETTTAPLPEPAAGRVRVQLESCGVCSSNLPPWEGRPWFHYPFAPGALGHEATGRIEALGAGVTGWTVGERVALMSQHSYAEFDVAKVADLVRLPPELDGKPFPGEPLGCAMNIFERSRVKKGDTVAIVGTGFLGLLLVQLCLAEGSRVLAIGRRGWAQEQARTFGAETISWGERWEMTEAVSAKTEGRFCDVVFEVTGKQEPLNLVGEITRERGVLIIAGYHQDGMREVNLQLWNWRGLDVINAHERDPARYVDGMRRAVKAVTSGRMNPYPLLTHTFPLEQLQEALRMTRDRPDGFLKAMVVY